MNSLSTNSRRSAFTLVELISALAGASLLLAGLTSTIFIATRAADTSNTPAPATLEAHAAVGQMLTDIQFAQSITERTATAITIEVPDRDLDAVPETIRFSWSGTPGDPLTRQYNGGTVATLAENVHLFQHDLPLPPPNLLSNADMEVGTLNWQAIPGATMYQQSSVVYSGSKSLYSYRNSASDESGVRQDVMSQLGNGTQYEIGAWMRKWTAASPYDVKVQLRVSSTGGGEQIFASESFAIDNASFRWVEGIVTPTWSGTLLSAYWEATGVTNIQDVYVDDARLQIKPTVKQNVNITLQVSSDANARLETAVTLLNEAL